MTSSGVSNLIIQSSKFLMSLDIDITDGLELLENIQLLDKTIPNININEKISGLKYESFINEINQKYNLKSKNTMPFTKFNLRHGVYRSVIGMVCEYISLKTTIDLFGNGEIKQDKQSQLSGIDILYHHNGNEITADIKTSPVLGNKIYCHPDWFGSNKTSTRLHVVGLNNNKHYIIGRSYFESMNDRFGNIIEANTLKKYGFCKETNISNLTKYFKD